MQSKRKRAKANFRTPRPVDKQLVVVQNLILATQVSQVLHTSTFPCTITGLRWDLEVASDHAAKDRLGWAIVIVKDGLSASALSFTGGSDFYTPEQNVLAFGTCALNANTTGDGSEHYSGSTKTMRKLMGGDQLVFIANGAVAANKELFGVVQFFCKT